MSRVSNREKRLRLYQAGNDRCPICLVPFTEQAVERGDGVTLEHVPPQSFGLESIAMCLTCHDCNSRTGRVEQWAVQAKRSPGWWKARMDVDGIPPQTAYFRVSGTNEIRFSMPTPRVPSDEFGEALRSGRISLTWHEPSSPRYGSIPWLKAAYLSVFSLLGVHGYNFADGKAIEPIRRQIMRPGEQIIPAFRVDASGWSHPDGVAMSTNLPCWAVKMGEHAVLLPRSWDRTFYERTNDQRLTLTVGILGRPVKFDHAPTARVTVRGATPPEVLGEDLFGKRGNVSLDGVERPVVVADYRGQEVVMLVRAGHSVNGGH